LQGNQRGRLKLRNVLIRDVFNSAEEGLVFGTEAWWWWAVVGLDGTLRKDIKINGHG
jgi:hypothetical protein